CVRSSVLPEPAGARTMQDCAASRAARRVAASAVRAASFIVARLRLFLQLRAAQLVDAAEGGEMAMLTGLGAFGVHPCVTAGVAFRQLRQVLLPIGQEPVPVLHRRGLHALLRVDA